MTRLVVAADAEADIGDILDYLTINAGPRTAAAYGERFITGIERLVAYPDAGASRPALGTDARVVMVYPYLMIYDFVAADDTATLLRVLHGKRNITEHLIKRSIPR